MWEAGCGLSNKIQPDLSSWFKDYIRICAHLMHHVPFSVGGYKGSSTEELVAWESHNSGRSHEPEVLDEITSQQSVKYAEEKVETIRGWWYLHQNTT